jgi:hypothetical protein
MTAGLLSGAWELDVSLGFTDALIVAFIIGALVPFALRAWNRRARRKRR